MKIDLIQYILQNSFMTNFQERFRGESNIVTVPRTSAGHSDD